MEWRDYVSVDPNVIFGKPAIMGTRLGVEFLLELFANGWDEAMIFEGYPHLTPEGLRAVFAYGAESIAERVPSLEAMQTR